MGTARLFALLLAPALLPLASETIRYSYDDAGRLARVEYGSGKTISYSYDKAGNLVKRVVKDDAPAVTSEKTRTGKPASGQRARR